MSINSCRGLWLSNFVTTPEHHGPVVKTSRACRQDGAHDTLTVIRGVADLENIVWWHRNLERAKGFVINGFLNHYPDFIVLTKNKSIVIVETKGDDRDNSNSKDKLKLGKLWEANANQLSLETGYRYHYMMVFDNNRIDGAYTIGEVLKLIEDL
ncbi:hypothetical protein [Paraburkholderia youngii]|uniref:hypothetical protein n=1 Tax=Paraburkholderia youngii TaxID=2782701 RepID=UPI00158FCA83|nr:hypothetical protein [Paraburkholderia youngii]